MWGVLTSVQLLYILLAYIWCNICSIIYLTNKKGSKMIDTTEKFLLSDDFRKSVNTSFELMNHAWRSISEDIKYLNTKAVTKSSQEIFDIFEDMSAKLDGFACVCNGLRQDMHSALKQAEEMHVYYALEC